VEEKNFCWENKKFFGCENGSEKIFFAVKNVREKILYCGFEKLEGGCKLKKSSRGVQTEKFF